MKMGELYNSPTNLLLCNLKLELCKTKEPIYYKCIKYSYIKYQYT